MTLPAVADYSHHPQVPQLLQTLQTEHGFSRPELDAVVRDLASANKVPRLIEAEQNAAEKTETWTTYETKRVDRTRILRGVAFLKEQQEWLAQAEADYGVPPAVVAGVLGLETNYGRWTGNSRVLDALATQGFDHPSRTPFFFNELVEFFVFCRDYGIQPMTVKGSYAGAMGWAQFMPSNYRRLAVDFDGDGRRDLWSAPDAIGSIAHYLVAYDPARRWQPGQPLVVPARIGGDLPPTVTVNGKAADMTAAQLQRAGVQTEVPLPANTPVGLIRLERDEGPEYWVGLSNFYSIMSYNPRVYYAMTVTRLATEMEAELARNATNGDKKR